MIGFCVQLLIRIDEIVQSSKKPIKLVQIMYSKYSKFVQDFLSVVLFAQE